MDDKEDDKKRVLTPPADWSEGLKPKASSDNEDDIDESTDWLEDDDFEGLPQIRQRGAQQVGGFFGIGSEDGRDGHHRNPGVARSYNFKKGPNGFSEESRAMRSPAPAVGSVADRNQVCGP